MSKMAELDSDRQQVERLTDVVRPPSFTESARARGLTELIAAIPVQYYWIAAKGRTRPTEPLYAIQILDAETGAIVAQAEADTLEDSIARALRSMPAEAA